VVDEWFIEDNWEEEDPLWRAALHVCFLSFCSHLEMTTESLNVIVETKERTPLFLPKPQV
jgi:hypothetical protein